MKSSPSVHLGRLFMWCFAVLLLTGGYLCAATAQTFGRFRPGAPAPAPVRRLEKPLSSYDISNLPLQRISQEEFDAWKAHSARASVQAAAAPAPPATNPQFFDLTTNPRPPLVGPSTNSRDIHPNWAWDQNSIFFASNNLDPVANFGATPTGPSDRFHIYQMEQSGNTVQQITGTDGANGPEFRGEQFYPAVNYSLTKLAYVHKANAADSGQLFVRDFLTGQRTQLTGVSVPTSPLNAELIGVQKPAWDRLDNVIIFSAVHRTLGGRNLYRVVVASRVVTQITFGTPANGVEVIDPTVHPQNGRIVCAANVRSVTPGGLLNYADASPVTNHNLFVMSQAGTQVEQLTNQAAIGADDVEPAFNRTIDPATQLPRAGSFNGFLAFSSKNRTFGSATVATTYDIYFYDFPSADASGDPTAPTENTTTRQVIRVFTPDTNAGAVPLNETQERYPSWSAGLPPQKPLDRIVFSSNRLNNVNDPTKPLVGSATDSDLWVAEVTDITPPTLFMYDEPRGEVLHIANQPAPLDPTQDVGQRIGAPGETFYFYARVKDLQYGVESVWVQVKDPDDASFDALAQNHKLYGVGAFPGPAGLFPNPSNNTYIARTTGAPPTVTHVIHLPFETDYEGIGITDYNYFNSPVRFDPGSQVGQSRARFASYNPGVDDAVSWSGQSFPPPVDPMGNPRWLRLEDDGRAPDLVAGDGVYSAQWIAPQDPSDYYVDLIAYDKAINPRNPAQVGNWIIYDNIWGFSTQAHRSRNPVLVVDDNGGGQKWPRGLKGAFRQFPSFRYGTESEIVDRPEAFLPREVRGGNLNVPTPTASFSAAGASGVLHFLPGDAVPYQFYNTPRGAVQAYRSDLWRILAKGPVPEVVLNDYLPTTQDQPRLKVPPPPPGEDPFTTIKQPVPRRAVLWNAPFMGDIFLGGGSLLDQATHTLLTNFHNRGGRLVVDGGDFMWALTGDNPAFQHPFLQNVLTANYTGDAAGGVVNAFQTGPLALNVTQDVFRTFAPNPVGTPPWWSPEYDLESIGTLNRFLTQLPRDDTQGNGPLTHANDGTPFEVHDGLALIPGAGRETVFANNFIVNDDAATRSKTVFMSFSLSSMGRRWGAEDDMAPLDCLNYRSKVSHAMFCWMFSTDLVGQVVSIQGGAPVIGALVEVLQGGQVVGAAFSQPPIGNYTIRGIPTGGYNIRVTNPGFIAFNKTTSDAAHGLTQSQEDIFLTPASPGSMSGRVVDQFNNPVPNVNIHAIIQAGPLYTGQRDFFALTQTDGTYSFPTLPVAAYNVTIDDPLPAGFGFPGGVRPVRLNVQVTQAQNTPNVDFTLEALPGPLRVRVFELDATNTRVRRSVGAEVTLFDSSGVVAPGTTAQITDANGEVFFPVVPAGPITVSAFKFGFQAGIVVVNIPQQNLVEIDLPIASPATLFGQVVKQIDNLPIDGTTFSPPLPNLELRLRGAAQKVLDTAIGAPNQGPPPSNYNYSFTAQIGQFTVAFPGDTRFFPSQVDVDITTNPSIAPVLQITGRPGILSGKVLETLAGVPTPVGGAQVKVISQTLNPGVTVATLNTAADGTWATDQIGSDNYKVEVRKFGYLDNTATPVVFVAGDTVVPDIFLTRTTRGQLYGLVVRGSDPANTPLGGIPVEFWTLPTASVGQVRVTTTITDAVPSPGADGLPKNYQVGNTDPLGEFLPVGTYEVRVPANPNYQAFTGQATVTAGQSTRFNITLTPLPGQLSGFVKENNGGAAGPGIPGATVRIRRGAVLVATVLTDGQGRYQTPGSIAAGPYTVTASAFDFIDNSVDVFVAGPTQAPDILLTRQPDSHVTGTIRSAEAGNPLVEGALVELLDASGQGPAIVTTLSTDGVVGTPPRNFDLVPVRAGNYILRVSRNGFAPQTRAIHVDPGVDLNNVAFVLQPEHTFGTGLHLISIPYDLPGERAAEVLGQPEATFKSAYWLTQSATYAIYPDPEAVEFRLGKGMFVRFPSQTAYTFPRGTAAANRVFSLPVKTGWNLIGNPRKIRIDWLRVKVATGAGTLTMQQAMDQGVILNGLFRFADNRYFRTDFLDPWSGYYMKALQDCTLLIPVDNTTVSITPADRERVARMPAPSVEQVAAELAALGLGPRTGAPRSQKIGNTQVKKQSSALFPAGSLSGLPRRGALFGNAIIHWPWRREAG